MKLAIRMNNFFNPFLLLSIFIIAGCAGVNGHNETDEDRFTNTTINHSTGNSLPSILGENYVVFLNMFQGIPPDGKPEYFLVLNSVWDGVDPETHLRPDMVSKSLYVIADAWRFSFSCSNQQGNRYWFAVKKDDLNKIAAASDVEIRVVLPDGTFWERKLSARNRQNFQAFAAKFLN